MSSRNEASPGINYVFIKSNNRKAILQCQVMGKIYCELVKICSWQSTFDDTNQTGRPEIINSHQLSTNKKVLQIMLQDFFIGLIEMKTNLFQIKLSRITKLLFS